MAGADLGRQALSQECLRAGALRGWTATCCGGMSLKRNSGTASPAPCLTALAGALPCTRTHINHAQLSWNPNESSMDLAMGPYSNYS